MSFFSKDEILERMAEKRAELGEGARADFNLALLILSSSLFEKRLKSGDDYGLHPLHVGLSNTHSVRKKIVGILHDVVEDSDWTLKDLRTVGFSDEIVDAVDAMTHREGELYYNSIERGGRNRIGTDKKIEDLMHNMDMSRHHIFPVEKDVERLKKYLIAHAYLVAIKKGEINRGSTVLDFVKTSAEFAEQREEALRLTKKFSSPKIQAVKTSPAFKPPS